MAINLLSYEVSDLCLGKPPLKSLSISSKVSDALFTLRRSEENYLSIWSCNHSSSKKEPNQCACIGKICMVDVVCYLCNDENLSSPSSALNSPISVLLPKIIRLVQHVDAHLSLLDALDLILEGAQNLVVPIQKNITRNSRKRLHQKSSTSPHLYNVYEFCWITQEDVVRFFLNAIGLFSPMPGYSIESLGIITTNVLAIGYDDSVFSAIETVSTALLEQTSIAVVDDEGKLVGDISPSTLTSYDETILAAISTLSAGDLMAYIVYGGHLDVLKARLKEKNLKGTLKLLDECCNNLTLSSSDEESSTLSSSSLSSSIRLGSISRSGSYSVKMVRSAEAVVCHPGSSLVAVMMEAIVHRVYYVWVIEDDYSLVGIVTLFDILKVFRERLQSIA